MTTCPAFQGSSPPLETPAARAVRLSQRTPPLTSAADGRHAEIDELKAELTAAKQAAADAGMATQKAATRRRILEGEVKTSVPLSCSTLARTCIHVIAVLCPIF